LDYIITVFEKKLNLARVRGKGRWKGWASEKIADKESLENIIEE
jgi:hypothetical protein